MRMLVRIGFLEPDNTWRSGRFAIHAREVRDREERRAVRELA